MLSKRYGLALILLGFGLLFLILATQGGCSRPKSRQPVAVPTPWCILHADTVETARVCFQSEAKCGVRRLQILAIHGLSADVGSCRLELN
jgi:hypothetical protein